MKGDFLYLNYESNEILFKNSGFLFLRKKFQNYFYKKIGNKVFVMFSDDIDTIEKSIFHFGTIIYRGKYNEEALSMIIDEDFMIDWNEVFGNYAILDFSKEKEILYLDPLRKFHVFCNKKDNILSSSFLATCYSSYDLKLDKRGFYERLLRGYNIAPDTLYENIKQVYYQEDCNIKLEDNRFVNYCKQGVWNNKKEILEYQKATLTKLFSNYESILDKEGGDLGLSGGYDSRLMLSVFKKLGFKNIQLHSHSIKNVKTHISEKKIAEKLANISDYKFKVIEVVPFTEYNTRELEKNLLNNWMYFDGRNSHNMGSMAPTYTSFYKKNVMGLLGVSMNGIGGETYRNYYKISTINVKLTSFLENHLFYRFSKYFIPNDDYNKTVDLFIKKVNRRLNIELKSRISLKEVRRYYNEIRMPDGDGNNHNAHNKNFDFLTPFVEPLIISSTNGIEKYLGTAGRFEGELIALFSPSLASIPTSYGKSANSIGYIKEFKNWFMAIIPQKIHRARYDFVYKKKNLSNNQSTFKNLLKQKSEMVTNYWDYIETLFPEVNWKAVNTDFASLANVNMMAITLYEFRHKTKI